MLNTNEPSFMTGLPDCPERGLNMMIAAAVQLPSHAYPHTGVASFSGPLPRCRTAMCSDGPGGGDDGSAVV